jgi:hypothetical protein
MFKLQKSPTFTTKVTLVVPTDEGQVEQTIKARFKLVGDELTQADPVTFLRAAVLSLSDIADEDGNQLSYDSDLLDKMLALPFARVGLVRAYWQAMAGAKLGN